VAENAWLHTTPKQSCARITCICIGGAAGGVLLINGVRRPAGTEAKAATPPPCADKSGLAHQESPVLFQRQSDLDPRHMVCQ